MKIIWQPEAWKRNIQKRLRQSGKSYISITTKKKCLEKSDSCGKLLCSENCRYGCDSIPDEYRKKIFNHYYSIDQPQKDSFIFNSMESDKPERVHGQATRNRNVSIKIILKVENEKRQVCKEAFCKLLGISRAVIDRIRKSKTSDLFSHPSNEQGKHQNRPNRVSESGIERVKEHIASFPTETSHYSRAKNPNRKYLSPTLSIGKMYDLYLEKCTDEQERPVSSTPYRKIFNYDFNLGFGSIKSDVCARCDSGEADDAHKSEIEKSLLKMKEDRSSALNSKDQAFITFDMEKTLPLPKVPTSVAFYLSQLWLYNVGIHVCFSELNNRYMHTWTEDQGGRGCEEVISSILVLLENEEFQNVRKLIAWSDSCAGQNKNFHVLALWQFLIASGRLEKVEQKFPEVGHTYMDSDRDFGLIEKACRKHERIFTPEEYRTIMVTTKKSNRFRVSDMSGAFIKGKNLAQEMKLVKRTKNVTGEKIEFTKIREMKVTDFGFFEYKTSFVESGFKVSQLYESVN